MFFHVLGLILKVETWACPISSTYRVFCKPMVALVVKRGKPTVALVVKRGKPISRYCPKKQDRRSTSLISPEPVL